jgi:hypothetical protein
LNGSIDGTVRIPPHLLIERRPGLLHRGGDGAQVVDLLLQGDPRLDRIGFGRGAEFELLLRQIRDPFCIVVRLHLAGQHEIGRLQRDIGGGDALLDGKMGRFRVGDGALILRSRLMRAYGLPAAGLDDAA